MSRVQLVASSNPQHPQDILYIWSAVTNPTNHNTSPPQHTDCYISFVYNCADNIQLMTISLRIYFTLTITGCFVALTTVEITWISSCTWPSIADKNTVHPRQTFVLLTPTRGRRGEHQKTKLPRFSTRLRIVCCGYRIITSTANHGIHCTTKLQYYPDGAWPLHGSVRLSTRTSPFVGGRVLRRCRALC